LYFDELAGKGLGAGVIFKFFLYYSPLILLNVMPLAILLAGIMSYGNMSEKSEFTAIKSMGISLVRSFKYTFIFILFLAVLSFIFANTLVPYGNYKFSQLRRKISIKKPSVAIKQGVFTNLENFNIYVREKYGPDKNKLKEVVIHQKVHGVPDKTIVAKSGILKSIPSNQSIQLILNDGFFYHDLTREQKKSEDRKKYPAMKTGFKKHIINIDVSNLNNVDFNSSSSIAARKMNFIDLKKYIDTINTQIAQNKQNLSKEILLRSQVVEVNAQNFDYENLSQILTDKTLINSQELHDIYSRAINKADALTLFSNRKVNYFNKKQSEKNKYILQLNEKFAFPLSVLIMFLVGVPLGAIIRKGGYSTPIIFGIIIFLIYYIFNMFGKNAAEEAKIPAWIGAWISSIVLLPLGLYLTYKSTNDSEFVLINNITHFIKENFLNKYFKKKKIS
jgi:lipopolysaccharide export system permease protein